MAKFYEELTPELQSFIAQQKIFFTATAPAAGRINLSPKGMSTFRCLDAHTVAYLDLTGSGNETAAHLQQDDRITVMFCSTDQILSPIHELSVVKAIAFLHGCRFDLELPLSHARVDRGLVGIVQKLR